MLTESYSDGKGHKTWAFTLNNYNESDVQHFKDLECQYIVFGFEVGDSGTPHLQGHLVFKHPTTLNKLKKNIDDNAHWSCVISEEHSANYCMKNKDYFLKDNRKQGTRTDLQNAAASVLSVGLKQTAMDYPIEYIKFHNGLEKYSQIFQKDRDFKPYVTWLWGPTGSGKTRCVVDKEPDLWISGKDLRWWQGYENQEATLFDDFRGDFCTFHELLRILDRYPYTVEVKGGHRKLNSKRMYITSPYSPMQIYLTIEDKRQLIRRIDEIIFLDNNI